MLGEFRVFGLDCAEEVAILRRELQPAPGVKHLRFDVALGKLSIEYDATQTGPAEFKRLVGRTGMRLEDWSPASDGGSATRPAIRRWLRPAVCGIAILAGMIWQADSVKEFFTAFLAHSHGEHEHTVPFGALACFGLAILIGVWQVAPKAFAALRMRRADMNLLVLLSMCGAVFLGEWSEGAMLAFLFSLAGMLEGWSISRAQRALAQAGRQSASRVCVIHQHGDHEHEHWKAVDQVREGELIRVRPGERIACDGEVVRGRSAVDESIVTGESLPVDKSSGSSVISGSINGDGALDIRVVGQPEDHTATQMQRLVADASAHRRAQSEQFVERMSVYYTPAVLSLALLVLVAGAWSGAEGGWHEHLHRAMLVLLVACPCALVISTPVTIAAALASAANCGVIIKGGAFLEEAGRLRAVVFDKTGVLTRGEPEVREFRPVGGHPVAQTLEKLVRLECASEHPIAKAVVRYGRAQVRDVAPLASVHAVAGKGIESTSDVDIYWAGNRELLKEKRLESAQVAVELDQMEASQYTAFVCGNSREVWAVAGLHDPIRREAARAIESLRASLTLHLVMLTGDNPAAAAKVQQSLGLDEVHASLLPSHKSALVKALAEERGSVAMIGDGLNDAPAMACATLGVAFGKGATGVAVEAADVVITNGDLMGLPFLLRHARRTARIIRQNVGIALGLKALFLIFAFYGQATLWMAVIADVGATVLVIFNGLRMLRPHREHGAA